jgi:hypothetical protein
VIRVVLVGYEDTPIAPMQATPGPSHTKSVLS